MVPGARARHTVVKGRPGRTSALAGAVGPCVVMLQSSPTEPTRLPSLYFQGRGRQRSSHRHSMDFREWAM